MADDFDRAKELFKLNERVFAIMGLWPLEPTYAKFTLWFVYQLVHTAAITADFFDVFGNFDLMILNFGENAWNIMVIAKMLVMRFSQTLADLTERVIDDVDPKTFESSEEKEIYLNYNRVAVIFFKLWVLMVILASIAVQIKPLESLLKTGSENESVILTLPYRTRLFFDLNTLNFWLLWVYQIPVIYLNTFHGATIGYVFSFILHVCGQMSVLAFRIKNIGTSNNGKSSKMIFHQVVVKHRKILGMVEDVNRVFGILLLEELLLSTILIGLAAYNVILNLDNNNSNKTVIILASLLESSTILLMIYGYCFAGEYLIAESANLYESYYQCRWYDMSDSFKKQLIICMIGASKPVQLLGGGFYIFSLASFTSVVKTAAGYISMLRAVI